MTSRKGISHAELQSRFRNGMSLLFGEFMGIGTPALCAVCSIRVSGI
jgi:acyl CoA:acetate/3-ketoacid CoA transferase alpha subunit